MRGFLASWQTGQSPVWRLLHNRDMDSHRASRGTVYEERNRQWKS